MKIVIEDYNPAWPQLFLLEKSTIGKLLLQFHHHVEHIGSTAVPGLGAKPIIDIMVGLNDFSLADEAVKILTGAGYNYFSRHESIMPERRFFTKESHDEKTHHIHMVQFKSEFWNRHIKFRDHLRLNDDDRKKYLDLKIALSQREWKDGSEYANAKTDFIRAVELL